MTDEQIAAADRLLADAETARRLIDHDGEAVVRIDDALTVARYAREAAARIAEQDREIEHGRAAIKAFVRAWASDQYITQEMRYRWALQIALLSMALAASPVAPEGRGEGAVSNG